MTLDVFMMVLN